MTEEALVLDAAPPQEIYADDGLELFYRSFAPAGEARGSFVYLHGVQSHGGWYVETAAELARRGYAVYLPDRRGSGHSLATRGDFERPEQLVADVAPLRRLARREHPDAPVVLAGGCWGARPALAYAARAPVRARRPRARRARAEGEGRPGAEREAERLRRRGSSTRAAASASRSSPSCSRPTRRISSSSANDPLGLHEVTASLLLRAVLLGPPPARDRGSSACRYYCCRPGTTRSWTARAVRLWFDRLRAPHKRTCATEGFGHILDFEPDRQRYWDDLAGWLDGVTSTPAVARRASRRTSVRIAAIDVTTGRAAVPLLVRARARGAQLVDERRHARRARRRHRRLRRGRPARVRHGRDGRERRWRRSPSDRSRHCSGLDRPRPEEVEAAIDEAAPPDATRRRRSRRRRAARSSSRSSTPSAGASTSPCRRGSRRGGAAGAVRRRPAVREPAQGRPPRSRDQHATASGR